jgi:hypothetical protein
MLDSARMRLATAGIALVLTVGASTAASAGTYIGLGIGSEATGSATRAGGLDAGSMSGYERSGRLMLGTRLSKLSVEGQGSRFDVSFDANGYQATQLGLALKLNLPLGHNFEVFGRGGVQRTWLTQSFSSMHDAAGNGWVAGGGFEYRLNLGVTAASIFVDYQRSQTDFTNDYMLQWQGTSSMWTLGATLAL